MSALFYSFGRYSRRKVKIAFSTTPLSPDVLSPVNLLGYPIILKHTQSVTGTNRKRACDILVLVVYFINRFVCCSSSPVDVGLDIDDCVSFPCGVDNECTDEINGYTCTCTTGYTPGYLMSNELTSRNPAIVTRTTSVTANNTTTTADTTTALMDTADVTITAAGTITMPGGSTTTPADAKITQCFGLQFRFLSKSHTIFFGLVLYTV